MSKLHLRGTPALAFGWLLSAVPARLLQSSLLHSLTCECRFYGGIPKEWGAPGVFPRLRSLILRNNDLSGRLPNSWNKKGAWRVLNRLDISANSFVGGYKIRNNFVMWVFYV